MKEQNKLIAEFMGYETHPNQDLAFKVKTTGNEKVTINLNLVKYNSSWDWLMPVIKKIDSYANEEMSISDFDFYRNHEYRMIDRPSKYEIEDVFNQVVQFINWYNQQNQA